MGLMTVPPNVGARLSADGHIITCVLPAMDGKMLIVGTSKGSVVAFFSDSDGDGCPIYATAMHNGPVHCISLSSTQLVATAGHDAVCCVMPLHEIFRSASGHEYTKRLTGHSLPVVATQFFTDGNTIASVSIDGHLLVHDVVSGTALCNVRCGFPTRTLALAADETSCYVAGKKIARIDLYGASRPAEGGSTLMAPSDATSSTRNADARMYGWVAEGEAVYTTAPSELVEHLTVSMEDNTLTAVFARRLGEAQSTPTAFATWRDDVPRWWISQTYSAGSAQPVTVGSSGHRHSMKRVRVEDSAADAPPTPGSSLLWPSWQPPCIKVVPCCSADAELPALGETTAAQWRKFAAQHLGEASVPATKAEQLEEAKERGRRLQSACDGLAQQLREALSSVRR